MPGQPAVQVKGAKELRRAMKHMDADLRDLRDVNLAAARIVAQRAEQTVPRRSGRLGGSVKPTASRSRGNVVAGSRLVPYAGPIHFGWRKRNIEPQPFLYDALDDRRTEVIDKYEAEIEGLVRRLDREAP
jgi:hypothetical protein